MNFVGVTIGSRLIFLAVILRGYANKMYNFELKVYKCWVNKYSCLEMMDRVVSG